MPKPKSKNSDHLSQRRRTMNLSIMEGGLYSSMVGFAQYFITPFAIALGLSSFSIGLLRSFSALSSAAGYYLGLWLVKFEKTRKKYISKLIFYQSYLLLSLIAIEFLPFDQSVLLIAIYSAFMLLGSAISPIWTGLMRDIVPKDSRASYFGNRNKIAGAFEVVSSIMAGAILTFLTNNPMLGFGLVFFFGFAFRFLSGKLISKHWDPQATLPKPKPQLSFINNKYLNNLTLLSAGMLFATNIAGPFFAIFMLRDLNFSYMEFTLATLASTFGVLVTQPYWGKLIDRYGTRLVLFSTSILIPFVPLLWIPASDLAYVILIQIYSGATWAGFDLAIFNMLLKISPSKSVESYSASLNGLSVLASFFGGIFGSFLVLALEGVSFGLIGGLQLIFLLSGVARFVITAAAIPRVTKGMGGKPVGFLMKVVTIYPLKGILLEFEQSSNLVFSMATRGSDILFHPLESLDRTSKSVSSRLKLFK